MGVFRCSIYYYFLVEFVLLFGYFCFRSRCNSRFVVWIYVNVIRSVGVKFSFVTKFGRRFDRRKFGVRGYVVVNFDL